MNTRYPTPQELGIEPPPHVIAARFCAGFEHALRGGQLTRLEHLRFSYREGYRAAKLYLRSVRRRRGVVSFPCQGRLRFRASRAAGG